MVLWYLCATLETFYILLSRLAGWRYNEDCTLPDSGCWFSQTATWNEGSSLWLSGPLAFWRNPLSLLWATSSEVLPSLFRTSWGHRGPHWVHLWGIRWLSSEEPLSRDPDQPEESRIFVSPFLWRNKYMELFSFTCWSIAYFRKATRRLSIAGR